MRKLTEVYASPTCFDSRSNYMGETPNDDLLVVMGRNRDSDVLTNSNWDCSKTLIGCEQYEIVRFGHWACGWIEYLCVKVGSEGEKIGEDIQNRLADYPVLCKEHFSEMETLKANEIWENCYNDRERLSYIRDNREQFEFYSMADLMGCVRGKYFAGYASELIG